MTDQTAAIPFLTRRPNAVGCAFRYVVADKELATSGGWPHVPRDRSEGTENAQGNDRALRRCGGKYAGRSAYDRRRTRRIATTAAARVRHVIKWLGLRDAISVAYSP